MNIKSSIFWGLLLAAVWSSVAAADPTPPRATGQVLVLENERTLEGDIVLEGKTYRIRRPLGEMLVPADKVQRLCATREEAYAYLRGRANLDDPDERLRLARWCHAQGLYESALQEAIEAARMRPNHLETQRLVRMLERLSAPPAPAPAKADADAGGLFVAVPEVSPDAIGPFVTRVQPILMNTCASCHANGKGGAFKLTRTSENALVNRRATNQNLAAVLAQVNRAQPQGSPLLVKALTVHGEALAPPLKGRQTQAFKHLEDWVKLAVGNGPAAAAVEGPVTDAGVFSKPAPAVPTPGPTIVSEPSKPNKLAPPTQEAVPSVAKPAGPVDLFDPAVFNAANKPPEKKD